MDEFEIVQWYIKVMEQGSNTKTLLKDFIDAKAEIERLTELNKNLKASHDKRLKKLAEKLKESNRYIVKMQNNVVKPLIQEVKLKEHLN